MMKQETSQVTNGNSPTEIAERIVFLLLLVELFVAHLH